MTRSFRNRRQFRAPAQTATEGRIVRVDADTRLSAVAHLVSAAEAGRSPSGSRAAAERFMAFSADNGILIDDMWCCRDAQGEILGTVLAVPNPGRTAIMFASTPRTREEIADLGALIDHACVQLQHRDVDLAQVLVEPGNARQREAFRAGGFEELAQLSYLERPLPGRRRTPAPEWPTGYRVEAYDERDRADLLAVLEASYEDTLDCPGLRGRRHTEDILAGHAGTGQFDPSLWTVLRAEDRAVGALLLNPSSASKTIELVYIGLDQSCRGRGLGARLLRHGLHQMDERPERAITLAVDEHNTPALALYRREGFRRVLRRTALIRSIAAPRA